MRAAVQVLGVSPNRQVTRRSHERAMVGPPDAHRQQPPRSSSMASLDSLIVIAAALAMAMSPLALGAWLMTRGTTRSARDESRAAE